MKSDSHSRLRQAIILGSILLIGLVYGLIFIWIMPPWQHYDEPGHFEYAWLLAQRGVRPEPGDYDIDMRRAVAKSMLDNGFFRGLGFRPDLKSTTQPAWIGDYFQFNNPPLYYAVIAKLYNIFPSLGVEEQLYLGRFVSLGGFLLSILAAWGIAGELFPPEHPMRLLLPLTLAMLPGYVDSMTALNNDAAANALVCLFLWAGVRLVRRGLALLPLLWMVAIAVLSYYTKDTTYLIYPLFLLVLVFTFLRGSKRWLAWTVVALGLVFGLFAVIGWGDAVDWYRSTAQYTPTSVSNPQAVVGKRVFQLESQAEITPNWVDPLFQPVPVLTGPGLPGNTYTLGGWMWASQPVKFHTPELGSTGKQVSNDIELGLDPTFFAITLTVPGGHFERVWVNLRGWKKATLSYIVYYDGLVLAEGARPLDQPPVYADVDASQGEWGGRPFQNLLRNASAEKTGLRIRPWADDLGARFMPDQVRPSIMVTYLLDVKGAWWFYRASLLRLLRTFWGMFGWGHVPLLGNKPYHVLFVISILGLVGAVSWSGRKLKTHWRTLSWPVIAILAFVFIGYWGLTWVRSPISMSLVHSYLPVARNSYPAIIPSLLLVSAGLFEMIESPLNGLLWVLRRRPVKRSFWLEIIPDLVYIISLLGLGIYSIWSIITYYGRV